MKYLIWLVIVFAVIWWIRQQRQTPSDGSSHKSAQKTSPKDGEALVMVPCAHCGAHMPQADALQGQHGLYCSEAHRQRQEG
jgi:uncharacterized protein